eukprot:gene13669-13791_t
MGILVLASLLYFCDDYHVTFSRLRIEGVRMMGQQCPKGSCFTCVVLFGGRAGSSAAANITTATVINNVVGSSAIAVAGSSHWAAVWDKDPGYGGGINAENATVHVVDSIVTGNMAEAYDNYAAFGGGGLSIFYGNLTVLNSNMAGNSCGFYGGLVELLHDHGMPFTAHFHNSNISGGSAESGGCVAALGGDTMDTTGTATAPQPVTWAPDSWLSHMFSFDPMYQRSCSPCPSHATCAGGAVVLADSGFFHMHHLQNCSLDQIYRCPNPSACEHTTADIITSHPYFSFMTGTAGNISDDTWIAYPVSLCSEGYRGVLCGACQLNYGQTDPFSCSPCLGVERTGEVDIPGMYGLLAAYAVIFVLVIWGTVAMISLDFADDHSPFVAVFLRQRWQAESSAAESDDSLQLTDVLKAFIMYAQIHDVGSHPTVNTSGLKALINLLLPLFVFLLVILGQLVYLQQHWVVTLLVTIFFFYPSMARVAVSMFTCIDVCGSSYWVMDMQAPCPRQEFMAAHTKCLDNSDFMGRYGFMYSDYNFASVGKQINTCHFKLNSYAAAIKQYLILTWDAVIHVQTVILVCVSVCGMVLHEYYQTLILAAAIALYLVAVVCLRPFRAVHSQKLQALSYAVLLATCMLLLVFIPPALMDERQEAFYKNAQPVAGVVLCVLNICYVGLAIYYLMRCLFREVGRRVSNRQQQQQQQEEGELSRMKHEAEQHQEEAEVLELASSADGITRSSSSESIPAACPGSLSIDSGSSSVDAQALATASPACSGAVGGFSPSREWLYKLVTFPAYFTPCANCTSGCRTPKREQLMTLFDVQAPYRVYCSHCPECKVRNSSMLLQVRRSAFKDVVKATDICRFGADVAGVQQYTLNGSKVIYLNREQTPEKKGTGASAAPASCSVDGRAMMDKSSQYCSLKCKMHAEDPGFNYWLDLQDPSVRILAQAAANAPPRPTLASKRAQPASSGSNTSSSAGQRPKKTARTSSNASASGVCAATLAAYGTGCEFAEPGAAAGQYQQNPVPLGQFANPLYVGPCALAGLKPIKTNLHGNLVVNSYQQTAPFLESALAEPQLGFQGSSTQAAGGALAPSSISGWGLEAPAAIDQALSGSWADSGLSSPSFACLSDAWEADQLYGSEDGSMSPQLMGPQNLQGSMDSGDCLWPQGETGTGGDDGFGDAVMAGLLLDTTLDAGLLVPGGLEDCALMVPGIESLSGAALLGC